MFASNMLNHNQLELPPTHLKLHNHVQARQESCKTHGKSSKVLRGCYVSCYLTIVDPCNNNFPITNGEGGGTPNVYLACSCMGEGWGLSLDITRLHIAKI